MKGRRSIFKTVVAPIVAAAVFLPTLTTALWAVLHGRGAAAYSNVYGLSISYTSLLIAVAAVLLALGVAHIARVVCLWRYGYGDVTPIRETAKPTMAGSVAVTWVMRTEKGRTIAAAYRRGLAA
jgi:hypothetical protein